MDRLELLRLWNACQQNSRFSDPARWFKSRLNKKLAKWTKRTRKRETQLFWGQDMTIVYPEFVSSRIARNGYFEDDVTSMFLDVLRPGMVVYDIGSHYGFFSLLASQIVGDAGQVIAFEPTPSTFNLLAENAARRSNIMAVNLAAFSETGSISFLQQSVAQSSMNFIVSDANRGPGQGGDSQSQMISVPAVALDDFVFDHRAPDFLKIDAEGAEGLILEGMIGIIKRSHPGISLEMGDQINEKTGNRPCAENVEFLMDHGYQVFDYKGGQRRHHKIEYRYEYKNLFFGHPQWQFMRNCPEESSSMINAFVA